MATQQESDTARSEVEEHQRSRKGSMENEIMEPWKKASFVLGSVAILLLAGLIASLAIFLNKTECGPPISRDNSTTTYLGSASPGTKVTYVCQTPLLFPDNSPSFTLTCTNDLQWEPKDIPSCGIYDGRVCSLPNLGLTLTGRPYDNGLQIEITLAGQLPAYMQVDIPTYDDALCDYEEAAQESIASPTVRPKLPARLITPREDFSEMVVVFFESADPWAPYEVRLRSIGTRLAVTVLQQETTFIVFTSFTAFATTPDVSDATNTTSSWDSIYTSGSTHTPQSDATDPLTNTA